MSIMVKRMDGCTVKPAIMYTQYSVFTPKSYRVLLVVEEAARQQHKVAQLPRLVLASFLVEEPTLLSEGSRT